MSQSRFQNIQLASFDVWKTLIKSNPEFKPRREALFMEAFGIAPDQAQEFSIVARNIDVACDEETDRTGIQFGPADRLRKIAEAMGCSVSEEAIEDAAQAAQTLFVELLPLWNEPELLNSLLRIKEKGIRLAIVSNTGFLDGVNMRLAFETMGLMPHISTAIFSNEVGVAKPDPAIFRALVDQSGVHPANILHIGDNPLADYGGATRAGLQAVLLTEGAVDGMETTPSIQALAEEIA
ncbi:MAG TPA: HAD family hydrolase [Verrucomicrobiae bacterium]|nr:HAD family hydrolase [Verrucomicrobiae bacterium]